jgi:putative acetyltransferase
MEIRRDDLTGSEIQSQQVEHLKFTAETTPPESIHALQLEELRKPEITFWTAWDGGDLMGCGALKALGSGVGEIKSMNTAARHRRKGVASRMLEHIMAEARARGYTRLYLETGSQPAYAPARQLYASLGFVECEPFAEYTNDPNSTYMLLNL